MPIKAKFEEWLKDESYAPLVIDAGHSKAIYTAEPYEPVQTEGLNQIM